MNSYAGQRHGHTSQQPTARLTSFTNLKTAKATDLLDALRHHLLHSHQLVRLQRRVEAQHLQKTQEGHWKDP